MVVHHQTSFTGEAVFFSRYTVFTFSIGVDFAVSKLLERL
jgi:hypothetical protein